MKGSRAYTINPFIERLHRSKKDYQRNMLMPLIGFFIIFLIILVIQMYFGNTRKIDMSKGLMYNNNKTMPEGPGSKSLPTSSGNNSSIVLIENRYVSFRNYRIVKDNQYLITKGLENYTFKVDLSDQDIHYDEDIDYSTLYNEGNGSYYDIDYDDGLGLCNDDKNLIEIAWDRFPKDLRQEQILIEDNPDIPALMEATEKLQYPKGSYYGTVILEFIILDKGEIEDITVMKEEPRGKGFLQCAIKYIESCNVRPAEKDGEKVNTIVRINIEFCKDCPFHTRVNGDIVFR